MRTLTTATVALALLAMTASQVEARRTMARFMYDTKVSAMKKFKLSGTASYKYNMKNGTQVRMSTTIHKGQKYSTDRTFLGRNGNSSRVRHSTVGTTREKTRQMKNGTVARYRTVEQKNGYRTSSREFTGRNGGHSKTTNYGRYTMKSKRWRTPTSWLGISTRRDNASGKLEWMHRSGGAR